MEVVMWQLLEVFEETLQMSGLLLPVGYLKCSQTTSEEHKVPEGLEPDLMREMAIHDAYQFF